MKKKLIQEQREKAIIESFSKTFNKIRRADEPKLIKENDEGLIEYDVPEWALSSLINGDDSGLEDEDIAKIDDFVNYVVKTHGNANFMLGDMDGKDNLGFQYDNDIDDLGSNVYRIYIRPSKQEDESIDEINIKKGLAGLGLAAALAGAPQKSMGQTMGDPSARQPQITMGDTTDLKSLTDAKAAITLIKSFRSDPFTADMWSKQSGANKKLFRYIKQLSDQHMEQGMIDQDELERFGATYKGTQTAADFLGRTK